MMMVSRDFWHGAVVFMFLDEHIDFVRVHVVVVSIKAEELNVCKTKQKKNAIFSEQYH